MVDPLRDHECRNLHDFSQGCVAFWVIECHPRAGIAWNFTNLISETIVYSMSSRSNCITIDNNLRGIVHQRVWLSTGVEVRDIRKRTQRFRGAALGAASVCVNTTLIMNISVMFRRHIGNDTIQTV
jgi:hypothetical protein